jgi:DNA-3-methyladenine glycosylase II
MRTIETTDDIAAGLAHLAAADKRLAPVIAAAGALAPRRRAAGFAGLARVIVGQQVSVASADAIWERCVAAFPEMTPQAIGRAREPRFRKAGLSAPKIRTLRAVAAACRDGLDLDGLIALPAEQAHAKLTAVKGIGPWTADIYLLFCLGHPDVFPAGDLALRMAVADAFGLDPPVPVADLAALAAGWSPWRSIAATLFWGYYSARKKQKKLPL